MLVELYPRVHRRYTSLAIIGPILDGYGTWLLKRGYSAERVREHFRAAPRLVRRPQQGGVRALTSLTRARLGACKPADSREDPNLAVLVRQLARYCESELSLYPPPALTRIEERVVVYGTYLQQVRGFAPSTVTNHCRTAGEFLTHIGDEEHPTRLAALDPRGLDSFLCAVSSRQSRASLQHVVGHLRAFLRFLASAGETLTGLDARIDTPRVYRGEQLPRALPWDTVRALLQSIDRNDTARAPRPRDPPSHGHLRPARVRGRHAHDRRRGVAGGAAAHPATQDARFALDAAHRRGRDRAARLPPPRTPRPQRTQAARPVPSRGAAQLSGAVSPLPHADGRSQTDGGHRGLPGLVEAKRPHHSVQGAHCLRHSYAVHLLRSGLSLKMIGDLLGHRTLESTCVYLRLAVDDLRDVALSLPAVVDCSAPGVPS